MKKSISFNVVFRIRKELTSKAALFNQIYDTRNYRKVFNVAPFVHFKCSEDFFEKGSLISVHFLFPFLSYKMKVVKVITNELIEFEGNYAPVHGTVKFIITEDDKSLIYQEPHIILPINRFYYCCYLLMRPCHNWYMKRQYKVLHKILTSNSMDDNPETS